MDGQAHQQRRIRHRTSVPVKFEATQVRSQAPASTARIGGAAAHLKHIGRMRAIVVRVGEVVAVLYGQRQPTKHNGKCEQSAQVSILSKVSGCLAGTSRCRVHFIGFLYHSLQLTWPWLSGRCSGPSAPQTCDHTGNAVECRARSQIKARSQHPLLASLLPMVCCKDVKRPVRPTLPPRSTVVLTGDDCQ